MKKNKPCFTIKEQNAVDTISSAFSSLVESGSLKIVTLSDRILLLPTTPPDQNKDPIQFCVAVWKPEWMPDDKRK